MIALTNADLERLRGIVAQRLGLVLDDSHLDQLAEVLRRRVRHGSSDVASYLDRLASAGPAAAEIGELANALTVGETYFFRHPDLFRVFSEVALPQRLAERGRAKLRILSAGCASGEEPYSLAIQAHEAMAGREPRDVQIIGIDASSALLAKASAARYSQWSLRATSPEQCHDYFRVEGRDYVLRPSIRSLVEFQHRNLLDDDPDFWRTGAFDIIFFRNVAIYFARETTKAVVARMARALAPGGFLFLGPSETLRGISSEFHLLHTHEAFYYQRRRPGETAPRATEVASVSAKKTMPPSVASPPEDSWVQAIHRASERIAAVTNRKTAAPGTQKGTRSTPAQSGKSSAGAWNLDAAHELLRQERFEEAMTALHALPAASAEDPDALLLRAAVLTNKGSIAEAEKVCRHVLQVDELNADAHYLLAVCREHAGERHVAVEHDRMAIYLDASFAMPHMHLGMMTRRCGDLSTARQELHQALTLLEQEDVSRILLFGGGFSRETLVHLCRAELRICGERK